jgi:fluoride exporter
MNVQLILAVAVGGAVGSVARYLVGVGSTKLFGLGFPWGTLLINIAGSFLIGVFAESFALKWNLPQSAQVLLTVGFCGGFTTFSTFSLDVFVMLEHGEFWPAAAYIVGSVVLSVGALVAGLHLIRAVA